ncbi:methyltransferase, ATP-grasp peptide maturase system [Nonomuraea maritima]|uniref:Protein-L-isoaspartate O-methyltransferase n=1 Tax=Nonomuraea maritima TaxID=683260 RepID=A0A1G9MEF0_9ACTN|nr:ATP-grasp peptide maturase system methyltransferase [Nonomuraea maritima]SDL72650.1 methyltransferase, ATP-grasp peptide maturase system [Nonomuraea maritima]
MNDLAAQLRHELAGQIGSPRWRAALESVPREVFVGDHVFRDDTAEWVPMHRSQMSSEDWLALVYSDRSLVTQVAGVMAEDATEPIAYAWATSSSTLPSLVVSMLHTAGISAGDKVLEIGTGTGYSTALLCHTIGAEAVTSIEYDPEVARRAEAAIVAAGYAPTLLVGDGLRGFNENAPYDRLIATCAVRTIPPVWLRQVRPGGTITAPMLGWLGAGALAHLEVADDGTASGTFPDIVYFQPARPHAAPPMGTMKLGVGDVSHTTMDPALLTDQTGQFVAQLAAPQAQHAWIENTLALHDVESGSHADVEPADAGGWTVHQSGPNRLWDAVERALTTWMDAGKLNLSAFGLTATQNEQRVWLGSPDGPTWDLPRAGA